jgi:hypothetical protein
LICASSRSRFRRTSSRNALSEGNERSVMWA